MKVLNVFENSCTPKAREHTIYYFCDGEYFIITRDSKDGYRENLTKLLPNIQSIIDWIVSLIKEGNDIYMESGTDRDEYHEILDTSVIMAIHSGNTSLDSFTYNTMNDIDELINICKKSQ